MFDNAYVQLKLDMSALAQILEAIAVVIKEVWVERKAC